MDPRGLERPRCLRLQPDLERLHAGGGAQRGESAPRRPDVHEPFPRALHAVADGPRKAWLEDQERGDGLPGHRLAVRLHEGLEAVAGAQQREPHRHLDDGLRPEYAGSRAGSGRPRGGERVGGERVVVHVEDARRLADALEHDAQPDEVQRGVVQHGAAEQADAELRLAAHLAVEGVALLEVVGAGGGALDPEVQLVDALPGLEGDDLAHRACVLARRRHRAAQADGRRVVEGQVLLHRLAVGCRARPHQLEEALLLTGGDDDRLPALELGEVGVERQRRGDLQHARGALGALEVASEPEAVIGHARDHGCSTQVSFEPPPWLELTT